MRYSPRANINYDIFSFLSFIFLYLSLAFVLNNIDYTSAIVYSVLFFYSTIFHINSVSILIIHCKKVSTFPQLLIHF